MRFFSSVFIMFDENDVNDSYDERKKIRNFKKPEQSVPLWKWINPAKIINIVKNHFEICWRKNLKNYRNGGKVNEFDVHFDQLNLLAVSDAAAEIWRVRDTGVLVLVGEPLYGTEAFS